jgi:hypothetical protein
MKRLRRLALTAVVAGGLLTASAPAAFGAEKHPPKFGVHDTQCSSDANQPHCPGNH